MVPVPQPGIARALNLREELFPARASTQREVKRGGGGGDETRKPHAIRERETERTRQLGKRFETLKHKRAHTMQWILQRQINNPTVNYSRAIMKACSRDATKERSNTGLHHN